MCTLYRKLQVGPMACDDLGNLSLCRHAVPIFAFGEVAEWDTPLPFNQDRPWACLAHQRPISVASVVCLGEVSSVTV
jgi:hypothetical protein